MLLAFLLLFESFSCTSVGVWLLSSSAAVLTRAEGGNIPSGEQCTGEMPIPWGAAALLLRDVGKLELPVGRSPCLGHLEDGIWHLLMKKQTKKNHLDSVIPFVSSEPPFCAWPARADVAKLQILKLVLYSSCSWAVPHGNCLVFLEAGRWRGRAKASETKIPNCAGTQTFAQGAAENTCRTTRASCLLISPRVPPI